MKGNLERCAINNSIGMPLLGVTLAESSHQGKYFCIELQLIRKSPSRNNFASSKLAGNVCFFFK